MKFGPLAALCAMTTWSGWTAAQPPEEREHARARLISETRTLIPGTTAFLGLDFEIDDHWHLYWNGVNDSGFAPKLNPAFPEGFKVGEVQWPAPKRLVSPGDILDHVYERHITLIIPVTIPENAPPGEVTLRAAPEWLVCHEVCLPGNADLTLKISVGKKGDAPVTSPEASLFTKARERIPKPIPKERAPIQIVAADGKITITSAGAVEMSFYPGPEGVALSNLIRDGQRKADKLVLSYKRDTEKPSRLIGVVEVKPQGSGLPMLWSADVDLGGANQSAPGPSNPASPARGR